MINVTVAVTLKKKYAAVGIFQRNIEMPFVPYVGTELALFVVDGSRTGVTCLFTVERLIWREISTFEKIQVYGTIQDDDVGLLRYFETSSEWKKRF